MNLKIVKLFRGQNFFKFFREGRRDLEEVADDAVVCIVEDQGVWIGVHRHHRFAGTDAEHVMDGARDAEGHIEFCRDVLSALSDLVFEVSPAFIHGCARRSDGCIERIGQILHDLEVLGSFDASACRNDDIRFRDIELGSGCLLESRHLFLHPGRLDLKRDRNDLR